MTETIAAHLDAITQYAPMWGFLLIFIFMTIESSFIPFPSEVVMIPAGFLAFKHQLTTGNPWIDSAIAILVGIAGSLAGAYINYYLALKLGRTFLHRYGKYFFLKEETLDRAEEIFREYGELATFVCRLLPAIRQLISIPAGLARMNLKSFTFYTGLGAGIWILILTAIGAYFGHLTQDMTYVQMIEQGKELIAKNYGWLLLGLVLFVVAYLYVHRKVMTRKNA